jgi:transcriptional regulator with XRE-family HTH domain
MITSSLEVDVAGSHGANPRHAGAVPIGPLIRRTRTERGLTQYRLADALASVSGNDGIGRDEVSRWERGKRVPGPYWRRWLADVLDIPPDLLRNAARLARVLRAHQSGSAFVSPPGSNDRLGRRGQ